MEKMRNKLTRFEFLVLNKRVDEIFEILDSKNCPDDVFDNLQIELDKIEIKVRNSLKSIQLSKFTLINGGLE